MWVYVLPPRQNRQDLQIAIKSITTYKRVFAIYLGGIKRATLECLISIYVFISNLIMAAIADRLWKGSRQVPQVPSAQSCQSLKAQTWAEKRLTQMDEGLAGWKKAAQIPESLFVQPSFPARGITTSPRDLDLKGDLLGVVRGHRFTGKIWLCVPACSTVRKKKIHSPKFHSSLLS